MKNFGCESGARAFAARAVAVVCLAAALASCGDDVDFCSEPGGECSVPQYTLDFHVQTAGTFGALQLDIHHLGNSGGFVGRGDKVDCVSLVDAIVASNYLGERVVKIGLISLHGINTPASIVRCGFRTVEEVTTADFEVEVTDASDTESKPIEPKPVVVVKSVVRRD